MRKVLGLVASPRKLGNTEMLVKEVLANAGDDCLKEMIRLTDLNLEDCKACYACLPKDADCKLKDDWNFLLTKIKEADAIVLGAPIYFLGPHGIIKHIHDRLLSVGSKRDLYQGKRCVTITTYGVNEWKGYAQAALNLTAHFMHLDLVDSLLFLGANPGEVWLQPGTLERVQQAGRGLLDPNYRQSPGVNQCPSCWGDIFRLAADGTVECPICAVKGEVVKNGDLTIIKFGDITHSRISPEAMKEHFEEWLVMKKEEFLANRQQYKEIQKPYNKYDWWISKP